VPVQPDAVAALVDRGSRRRDVRRLGEKLGDLVGGVDEDEAPDPAEL
jgi:hypothetical protein